MSYTTRQDFILNQRFNKFSKHQKGAFCYQAVAALDCNDNNYIVSTQLHFLYSQVTSSKQQYGACYRTIVHTKSYNNININSADNKSNSKTVYVSECFTGDHYTRFNQDIRYVKTPHTLFLLQSIKSSSDHETDLM